MTRVLAEAERLARCFGAGDRKILAVDAASFVIRPGDSIALTGPSGSGKSTLLNLLAGLDEPTSGHLTWPGIGSRDALRPLAVGMIHQFAALIPSLTVAENVALPLRLGHVEDQEQAVLAALEAVDLLEFADRLPDELSSGQAQRAGIARVLAHRPRLLLADEPTGQLDQATGQAVISSMLDHAGRNGTAVVIATHDPAVAGRLRTSWLMDHGRLEAHEEATP